MPYTKVKWYGNICPRLVQTMTIVKTYELLHMTNAEDVSEMFMETLNDEKPKLYKSKSNKWHVMKCVHIIRWGLKEVGRETSTVIVVGY